MSVDDRDEAPPTTAAPSPAVDLTRLLDEARVGTRSSVGQLLHACRDYLLLVAGEELGNDVRQKVAASDIVQDSILEAYCAFPDFRGRSDRELLAWLRQIVRNNVLDATRRLRETERRDVSRELPLIGGSTLGVQAGKLESAEPSPSGHAIAAEEQALLRAALKRLPEVQAQVICLRNLQYLSFVEIASQLGMSESAVRKNWQRGVDRLAQILKKPHDRPRTD